MEALIYFALLGGLFFLMMRFGSGAHVTGHGQRQDGAPDEGTPQRSHEVRWVPPETDVDPVCGKTVHTDKAKPSVHDGMVYYFCSRECRERFEAAPQLYVGPGADRQLARMNHAHG